MVSIWLKIVNILKGILSNPPISSRPNCQEQKYNGCME